VVVTVIRVRVKPRARSSTLEPLEDGSWLAKVTAPAAEGKANKELVGLIADQFGCAKAAVTIKSGMRGRIKLISVETG
jgi:uncharacterized protein (TIGR00251 family)